MSRPVADVLRRAVCRGRMVNTPSKMRVRCEVCGLIDYEKNEGDLCGAYRLLKPCGMHGDDAICGWCYVTPRAAADAAEGGGK